MLLDQPDRKKPCVAVLTRNQGVNRLLTALFENWKFEVTDHVPSADLVFLEWGLTETLTDEKRVWLAPQPVEGRHLKIPLSLGELYRCLEEHFFPKPRALMRQSINLPAKLFLDGQLLPVELLSLSGRGARLTCPREVSPGDPLSVELVLAGRSLLLPGEVIYQLPASDVAGGRAAQLGVLFRTDDVWLSTALTLYVERVCAEKACALAGISPQDACLSWLAVPNDPWGLLP